MPSLPSTWIPSSFAASAVVLATPVPYTCLSFVMYSFLTPSSFIQSARAAPWMWSAGTTRA